MPSLGEYFLGRDSKAKSLEHHTLIQQHFINQGREKRQNMREQNLSEYLKSLYYTNLVSATSLVGLFSLESPKKYWLLLVPLISESYRAFSRKVYQESQENSMQALRERDKRRNLS